MTDPPERGRRVGRYEILRELGRGGMARVHLARQLDLDRLAALKELAGFHVSDRAMLDRFFTESRLAGSLNHPNVVTVFDFFEVDGTPFIGMEYVPHGSLRTHVGWLTLAQIGGVLEGMLAGLAHAHAAGVVHRDLKPENLMVSGEGRVKLADFGIAKAFGEAAETVGFRTATGTVIGTPNYMSPEQASARPIGPWTDVYATGVIAYELLAGALPFTGGDPMSVLLRHCNEAPQPLSERNPEIPPQLSAWVDRMLAKEPTGRPASADAAWDELDEILLEAVGPRWRREAQLAAATDQQTGQPPSLASSGSTPPPATTFAPARALPSGTLTLLFTDIEASTRLVRDLGERYPPLLAEHQRRLRAVASAHGGAEVDTQGDAFFFVFTSAAEACASAAEMHAALDDLPIRVRIGIHTGEPERVGDDFTGIEVHRAARICAAGHGGQTVVSDATRALLPASAGTQDLGLHRLKDLGEPEKLFQLGTATFPQLRSLNATNLPAQPSPLIGRGQDVVRITKLVRTHRLVTLTGAGGSGKTRLALHVAGELVAESPHGVYWVPLASVHDPALVLPSIAEALGTQGSPAEHIDQKRMLLLLDNLEQIVDCAGDLAGLVAACPNLTLLVTSRALLRVAGECVYEVEPLVDSEAVELFRERAVVAEPLDVVREICRRLDRLPLAIELAAARTRILPPAELLGRLERALPILTGGMREAPERQRTLRAAIEWSHDLLPDEQRVAFRRLAVFAGGFDLEAAESVCEAHLDILEALLDQSLLRRTQAGRLFMLETIHEFASEKLDESAEAEPLREAHVRHYLDLAERGAPQYDGYPSREWVRRMQEDEDNLRAALEWAIATARTDEALRLCIASTRLWEVKGRVDEGARWTDRALALPTTSDARLRVRALRSTAKLDVFANRDELGLERARASIRLARELGDPLELAASLRAFATAVFLDTSTAQLALDEALELSKQATDPAGEAMMLNLLGALRRDAGDLDESEAAFERSIAIARDLDDQIFANLTIHSLGDLELDRGNYERARSLYREALLFAADNGEERLKLYCLGGLAAVAALEGSAGLAAKLWQALEAGERSLGFRIVWDERARYERALEPVPAPAEPPLDLDAAIAIALADEHLPETHATGDD